MFVSCAQLVSYDLGRRPGTPEFTGRAVYLGSFRPSRKTSQEEAHCGHFSVWARIARRARHRQVVESPGGESLSHGRLQCFLEHVEAAVPALVGTIADRSAAEQGVREHHFGTVSACEEFHGNQRLGIVGMQRSAIRLVLGPCPSEDEFFRGGLLRGRRPAPNTSRRCRNREPP